MRRPLVEIEREQAAEQLELTVKEHAKQQRKQRGRGMNVEQLKAEAQQMREQQCWATASPKHLVLLHAMLHEHVYGVAPDSGSGKTFTFASSSATKMLREEFANDPEAMVDYLRWSWQREQDREEWRRKNGRDGGRLDWRRQFAQRCVLTDYRVDQARRKGAT